jgi:hypothetical protein
MIVRMVETMSNGWANPIQITLLRNYNTDEYHVRATWSIGNKINTEDIILCDGKFIGINETMEFLLKQVINHETGRSDDDEILFEEIDELSTTNEWETPYGNVVYFIQPECGGPIKIGYSSDVRRRIEEFQPGCPYKLKPLLCVRGGTIFDEKKLHRKFEKHRLHGEWFKPVPEIFEFIEELEKHGKRKFNGGEE